MKPVRSKTFLATLSVLVVVAGTLVGANVASADSVLYQSYGRASQSEACTAQVGETPWQASWGADPSWIPSYEMWANNGTGGWTCGRSITWAKTPVAASSGGGSVTYALGDIGPGGGLVFLISGGLTYEMAPKNWSGVSDPTMTWCDNRTTNVSGARDTAVGKGAANTAAMAASGACSSDAAAAVLAYAPAGTSAGQWYLPSKDELNAMYTYSLVGGFNSATYGFAIDSYWSSSEIDTIPAWAQNFSFFNQFGDFKDVSWRVRPVRAF